MLIANWRSEMLRLWSMRAVLFWTAFWSTIAGFILVWPALIDVIPRSAYIFIGVGMCVSIGVARLLKQPGAQ